MPQTQEICSKPSGFMIVFDHFLSTHDFWTTAANAPRKPVSGTLKTITRHSRQGE